MINSMFNPETEKTIFVCYTKMLIGGILDGIENPVKMEIPDDEDTRAHWQIFADKHNNPNNPVKPVIGKQAYWIRDFHFEEV